MLPQDPVVIRCGSRSVPCQSPRPPHGPRLRTVRTPESLPQVQPALRLVREDDVHAPPSSLQTARGHGRTDAFMFVTMLTSIICSGSLTVHTMTFFPAVLQSAMNLQRPRP